MTDPDLINCMTDPVLIIGDLILDWWWRGEVRRTNPEYPSPLVSIYNGYPFMTLGGAGNVQTFLTKAGIPIIPLYGKHHPAKHRLLVGQHEIARWDVDDYSLPIEPHHATELVDSSAMVVVVDYNKGSVHPPVAAALTNINKPVLVSTKTDPSPWLFADALFANESEYDVYSSVYSRHPFVVVTKGPRGAEVRRKGTVIAECPSRALFVKSVCGAGDVVLASCVVWWYTKGKPSDPAPMLESAMKDAAILVQSDIGVKPDAKHHF